MDDERGDGTGGHVGVREIDRGRTGDLSPVGTHGPPLEVHAQNEVRAARSPVGPAGVVGRGHVVEDDPLRQPVRLDVRDEGIGIRARRGIGEPAVARRCRPRVRDELEQAGPGRGFQEDERTLAAPLGPGLDRDLLGQDSEVVGGGREPGLLQRRADQDPSHRKDEEQDHQDDEELDERNAPLR